MAKSTGRNNSLILRQLQAQPQLPEEQTYQARLRAAAAGVVTEADVQEVVRKIVKRAKDGEKVGVEQLFTFVLGVNSRPTKVVNNILVADKETVDTAVHRGKVYEIGEAAPTPRRMEG